MRNATTVNSLMGSNAEVPAWGVLVQARLGSTRLPGKMQRDIVPGTSLQEESCSESGAGGINTSYGWPPLWCKERFVIHGGSQGEQWHPSPWVRIIGSYLCCCSCGGARCRTRFGFT
jgi:hypothetical protein